MRYASDIVLLIAAQANVTLLKIGQGVKNDELNFIAYPRFKQEFNFGEYFTRITGSINGQFLAIEVKIGVKIVETIVSP